MKVFTSEDLPQRSPEWFAARLGRLTGSVAADMMATIKSGEAASRRNLRIALALERVTGVSQDDGFITKAMQDGIDREPDAINAYQAKQGVLVDPVGFVQHDSLMAGYSPDGVVNEFEGLIEVKCPEPSAHWDAINNGVPGKYLHQMRHGLWITGAQWCDFVSFNPTFPAKLQLVMARVTRDGVDEYAKAAQSFLLEVDALVQEIQRRAA